MKLPLNYSILPYLVGLGLFFLSTFSIHAQVQIWGSSKAGGSNQIGTIFSLIDDGSGYDQASVFVNNPEGAAPRAALAETGEGVFIGTTSTGGLMNAGTIFTIEDGAFTKLADLDPSVHGSNVQTDLLRLSDGSFIIATSSGAVNGAGAILNFDENGNVEVLFEFSGATTGSSCSGSLAYNSDSNIIYGLCSNGGQNGLGTAFRFVIDSGIFSVIYHFAGADGGSSPKGGLVLADDGLLYGTAQFGGSLSQGTIFSIDPIGNDFQVVYELNNTSSDGRYPVGRLIQTESGLLLGTCSEGGTSGTGTIFSCSTSGTFTRLHSLSAAVNGGFPKTGLTDGGDGFFYGVTEFGAANGFGSLYRIQETGSFEKLRDMQYTADGSNPVGGLTLLADGALLGSTSSGGANNFGTVFRYDEAVLEKIHDFSLPLGGAEPNGIINSNTDFFGVTASGGLYNTGVFYTSDLSGDRTKLYDFEGSVDGQNPNGEIVEVENGTFYGTLRFGGPNSAGTVYSLTDNGDFELIHAFDGSSGGQFPYSGVVAHSDGSLYGTTINGGAFGDGIIYRITSEGTFEKLYDLFGFFDGGSPEAGLTEGPDGFLYGLTTEGGNFNGGTLFQFDPENLTLLVQHHFNTSTDGSAPIGDLLLHSDGSFYGTTTEDGPGEGTLFRYNLSTGFEVLHSFDPPADGFSSEGSLAEDEVGTVYGFCRQGGGLNGGTAFKYSGDNGFQKIFDFSAGDSQNPIGTPALFFPECLDDSACIASDPCSVGVCNFGICEEVVINPVFSAVQIGLCETGLDLFDMLVSVNMDICPGGTLIIGGNEFDLVEGVNSYVFEIIGLPADANAIDLSYEFEETGCSGQTGNLGTAPIPCPPIETTFRVDVSNIDVDLDGMHLGGNFQGWTPSENPMTEIATDIWEITIEVGSGEYEFNFFNGSSLFDGEYVVGECATNGKRALSVADESQTIEFCWEECFYDCNFLGTAEDKALSFHLYPNPINQGDDIIINLPSTEGNWSYHIIDITGRQVQTGSLTNDNRINSGAFASGMYHIYLRSGSSYTRAEKFMVR
ncbi:MAG TPA: choice-of-anchor tandem repeat GloVer-containing protein [Cryomorphaceae bacterium]|nr:choice-of-anchor tandem repeat GloVer-containing protein [Cryomorphaceae bacterium]